VTLAGEHEQTEALAQALAADADALAANASELRKQAAKATRAAAAAEVRYQRLDSTVAEFETQHRAEIARIEARLAEAEQALASAQAGQQGAHAREKKLTEALNVAAESVKVAERRHQDDLAAQEKKTEKAELAARHADERLAKAQSKRDADAAVWEEHRRQLEQDLLKYAALAPKLEDAEQELSALREQISFYVDQMGDMHDAKQRLELKLDQERQALLEARNEFAAERERLLRQQKITL